MKKLFLSGLMICSLLITRAQNTKTFFLSLAKNEIIQCNSSTKCDPKENKLSFCSNDLVVFHLKDVNPFKYDYVLNYQEKNYFSNSEIGIDSIFDGLLESVTKEVKNNPEAAKDLKELENIKYDSLGISKIKKHAKELNKQYAELAYEIEKYSIRLASAEVINEDEFKISRETYKNVYKNALEREYSIREILKNKNDLIDLFEKEIEIVKIKHKPTIEGILSSLYGANFYLKTLPIDVNGKNIDAIEIIVKRRLKGAADAIPPETYTYNLWTKGTLKIDVSGGIFITSLLDREYITSDASIEIDGQTFNRKTISEKNVGNYGFGFGTTTHVYWTLGTSKITPSFNFGALLTSNQKFQFLFGGSLIFGKMERVILQGGLTMGSVSRLGNGLRADGTTLYDLGSNGIVPTVNQFNFGHYFGITYNFSKPKIQN